MKIARYIDHAVLKPELNREETIMAIQLGIDYQVRTVCVRPCDIELAVQMCRGTQTDVSCVLAFPHGCIQPSAKAVEAKLDVAQGAKEIDMVANIGLIRSGLWDEVYQDIKSVADVTRPAGVVLKVIMETVLLSLEEIRQTTQIAIRAGADFVKTSTGFNGSGASVEAVQAMLNAGEGKIKVKPSGGIRDRERAELFVNMGCHRLGIGYTSTAVICEDQAAAPVDETAY